MQSSTMKLTHKLVSYKKVPDGILMELEAVDGPRTGPQPKRVLVFKDYVGDELKRFVAHKDTAGWYHGADVSDKTGTTYLRYLGHTEWDAAQEMWIYYDLCTTSGDLRHLLGSNGINGEVQY